MLVSLMIVALVALIIKSIIAFKLNSYNPYE